MGLVNNYKVESNFLKATDMTGPELTLTITGLDEAVFDDGKKQPTLLFQETEKQLGLNVTNREKLAELFGLPGADGMLDVEPAALIGQQISVYKTMTKNRDGMAVPCVRIRAVRTGVRPVVQAPGGQHQRAPARAPLPVPPADRMANAARKHLAGNPPARPAQQPAHREPEYDADTGEQLHPGDNEPF